ncbi:MAG: YceI family protein [Bacteroidota bacterium]|nr:YceI family protein [Bacteroidota bacterium]
MKKLFLILLVFAVASLESAYAVKKVTKTAVVNYKLDQEKSEVKWTGKKVTGQHTGTIQLKSGMIVFKGSAVQSGNFVVDMKTIVDADIQDKDSNSKLIGHLNSEDFFGTEKYPTATYTFNKAEKLNGNQYVFKGKLTIKGTTKDYDVKATVSQDKTSYTAVGQMNIDRTAYNIRYGSGKFFDKLGDKVINDTFTLEFKVTVKK